MDAKTDDWGIVAYGLLVCIAAICVTYLVLRIWPRQHYPRFFAVLAGTAAVAAMYVYQVPGAGFALGALGFALYIGLHAAEGLFEPDTDRSSQRKSQPRSSPNGLGHIALGFILGLVVSAIGVAALIMPPASLKAWITHPDAIQERVRRALDPGKDWMELISREREATQAKMKLEVENTALTKRASEAQTALAKSLDEFGAATSNTVRAIAVKPRTGSRHANGLVYIGVRFAYVPGTAVDCSMTVSTDKSDAVDKNMKPGEAIKVQTSKGLYRVVLVGLDQNACTFDLVKD